MAIELNEDPMSTIGATEEYKAAWQDKYGKEEADAVDVEAIELDEDPSSTIGASDEYKDKWHAKYGNHEPAGNAAKPEWVDYAVLQGADRAAAEDMTVADLKDAYAGSGVISAPTQADAPAAAGTSVGTTPGAGVNSGTPGGTAATTGTPSEGAKAKA